MKTTTIGKYDIDIENIQKKIQQVQDDLSGSEMKSFIPKTLLKDMDDLQKKLEKFRKTSPVSTSTHKDIEKFLKEWERVSVELDDLDSKMSKISFSDTGIKENIKEVSELVNKYKEAVKARKDYAEKITSESGVKNVTGGIYRAKLEGKRNKMAEAATKGSAGIEEIKSFAQDGRSELKERLTWINQNRTSPETIKKETKEVEEQLKLWNAIEQSALRYAENQQRNIDNENEINIELQKQIQFYKGDLISGLEQRKNDVHLVKEEVENTTVALKQMSAETLRQEERQSNINTMTSRIKDMFSAATAISTIRHIVHGAIQDFQELDKQFNEIAIVSDYSTKEMWSSFSKVNKVAQEFGVETKNVLEVQNLYYHQGKDMAEVNKLTAQTLTLAKITGMDYERATSDLTAALNAYNIAAEDAVRVTDTIAAMDTNAAISSEELMTALTKTASIAANAGMSLESTEVFLTKMIETTREAPENLGTALKTIIARFGEVKQEIDGEEIELADINRVDTALKSIGISLLDTAGQIRDLDGVFMELSSKWDDLDRNTQRYIATIAAGSRQQSRFIAMMEDYDRTLELTEIAQNSAGLGARQLAKSQESIETSVNRLKSTWQEFYSSLITSGMIKGVLELANSVLSLVNGLNDISPLLGTIVAALAIWAVKTQIADKLVLKLGQSLGQGIGQGSIFEALLLSTVSALDKEAQSALLASKAFDRYRDSLIQAGIAEKGIGVADLPVDDKQALMKQKGILDDNGDITLLGEKYEQAAKSHKKKTGEYLGVDDFLLSPKGSYFKGKENTLTKLLGKEGAAKYLKETGGLSGAKGILGKGKSGLTGIGAAMKAGTKGLLTSAGSALSSIVGSLGAILTTLGPIIAAIGIVVGLAIAWKENMTASLDDTKEVEKLSKAQEGYNKQLQETNNLKEKAKQYEQYRDANGNIKKNLTVEQMQEEQEIAKALVAEYPSLLDKIDEEGNYHLKNAEAIQKEIDAKEKLLDQSASTYNNLRLKYAEQGIYTDTSTQAGQAIKNIQDYAATFGTEKLNKNEDLKAIAKKIDSEEAFNASAFYDIMEAYATGKKSSFANEDFTQLFKGDIQEDNWEELLTMVKDGLKDGTKIIEENGEVNETALAEALEATRAYNRDDAESAARTFVKLNEELGGLYGQLLQGAAYEQSEIYIQMARLEVNKINFDSEVSNSFKDAISAAAVKAAKGDMTEEEWIDLGDKRDELVESQIETWRPALENLTKEQLADVDSLLKEENALGANITKLSEYLKFTNEEGLKLDELTDPEDMRKALTEFWNLLPREIRTTMPEMKNLIEKREGSVIQAIFEGILGYIDDEDIAGGLEELINEYGENRKNFKDPNRLMSQEQLKSFYEDANFSGDQFNQLNNILSTLDDEQRTTYQNALAEVYNKMSQGLDDAQKKNLLNTLLDVNFVDAESIQSNMAELNALGLTSQEVFSIMQEAANGAENVVGTDLASIEKRATSTAETFKTNVEGMAALIEGTANSEQLSSYLNTMMQYYSRTGEVTEETVARMASLSSSIKATGKGFEISTSAADDYGEGLYDLAIESFNYEIAILKAQQATAKANGDFAKMLELEMAILKLESEAAMLDAQRKQSRNDALVDKLTKAKEKADELVNSLKNLVDWLRGYDRYANLDEVISSLEEEYGHLDFEINFSTNTDVIEKDLQEQVDNINTQIFANQGGIQAAKEEQSMWRDTISKRNSQYVSFNASGNAIVNAEKLRELQEDIADASEERKPVLQAEYDEIMDNVEAYNKAKDKVEDYSKALEENFKALEDYLKANYEAIMKVENKLIDARMAAEDKELEKVKEKYEAIKEENDKYLEDVQEMIDKEREIRDRADKEQDVKDKEKKLAMMRMDTSGIYASDIRALEEELEGDYRDLEDDAVDKAIADLEKEYQTQAEILDKEVDYLESSLEYRREIMIEYNQWAQEMMMQGSDTVIEYLKANDEEYYTGTAAAQANWVLEWNNAVAQGVAANNTMATTLDPVMRNLETCQTNANGFEGAVQQYSETALAMNPEVNSTVEELVTQYSNLADGVGEVDIAMTSLASAYRDAADAAAALKYAQDMVITGTYNYEEPPGFNPNDYNDNSGGNKNTPSIGEVGDHTWGKWDDFVNPDWNKTKKVTVGGHEQTAVYIKDFGAYVLYNDLYKQDGTHLASIKTFEESKDYWYESLKVKVGAKKYAKGGYVDYTGPAWVDGTKSHPEYMLNATQTAQFEALVAALSNLYGNGMSSLKQSSQKIGDAYYNFHINVDQMASDYDVDQLVSRLEQKMVDSSKYRNITLLKKSQ